MGRSWVYFHLHYATMPPLHKNNYRHLMMPGLPDPLKTQTCTMFSDLNVSMLSSDCFNLYLATINGSRLSVMCTRNSQFQLKSHTSLFLSTLQIGWRSSQRSNSDSTFFCFMWRLKEQTVKTMNIWCITHKTPSYCRSLGIWL